MNSNNQTAEAIVVDRSAIFSAILARQALRREAHLPLLNISAEYHRAVDQALWSAHVERHYDRVRTKILEQQRAKFGSSWGYSAGGRWAVEILTRRALETSFRCDSKVT